MSLKERAKKLKTNIPAVFLALKKKETPFFAKLFAFLTVAYALSPIDFIPDFIPVLGYLDDLIILPLMVAITVKFIPKEIFDDCVKRAEHLWDNGKPVRWYYAIPIVLFWALIVFFIIRAFI